MQCLSCWVYFCVISHSLLKCRMKQCIFVHVHILQRYFLLVSMTFTPVSKLFSFLILMCCFTFLLFWNKCWNVSTFCFIVFSSFFAFNLICLVVVLLWWHVQHWSTLPTYSSSVFMYIFYVICTKYISQSEVCLHETLVTQKESQ